ncbi:MAG: copper resistance CopC/CopD family protein [Ilumatobacteraceae bacterium]
MPFRTGVLRRPLLLAGLGAIVFMLLGLGTPAAAQDPLETQPADSAQLAEPPQQILLRFEQPVDGATISMSCLPEGAASANPALVANPPTISDDGLTISAAVLNPPPAGVCNVAWTVTRPDAGADSNGSFSFSLSTLAPGQTTVPGSTPTDPAATDDEISDASDVSNTAIWLGQVLSTFGVAVLFGSIVLIVAAWPEGPEYVLAVRFLRSTWLLGAAGTLLYVVALSATVRGDSLGSGLNPAGWLDLFEAGVAGQAALARLVLFFACGWVVLRPERVIDPTTQFPAVALPALATVTLGLTRTAGDLVLLGVIAGIAHALAMALWLGALILLARVVLAGPGEEDLVHAVRGFGRLSGPAIIVTVISGLVQLYRLDGSSLFGERHGQVLLAKTVLVAAMLFIGLTARQVAQARLQRSSDLGPRLAHRLRRAFGTEAVIGLAVVALSGWLLALDPGKLPEPVQDFTVEEPIVDTASGIDLTISLDPGRVGVNLLRVEVRAPATGLAGLEVSFVPPVGSSLPTIVQPIPLAGAGIAQSPAGSGIPLEAPGVWTLQISATTPTGSLSNAGGQFDVRTADGELLTTDIGTTPSTTPVTPVSTLPAPPVETTAPPAETTAPPAEATTS